MNCPACGKPGATNDQFCEACGTNLQQEEKQFSEIIDTSDGNDVVKACGSCGAGLTTGQNFCTVCGAQS